MEDLEVVVTYTVHNKYDISRSVRGVLDNMSKSDLKVEYREDGIFIGAQEIQEKSFAFLLEEEIIRWENPDRKIGELPVCVFTERGSKMFKK